MGIVPSEMPFTERPDPRKPRRPAPASRRPAAGEAGRESERQLRAALDAAQIGTWEWDVATGAIGWSENLEALHGLPTGSFAGTFEAFQELIHPDDRWHVLHAIQRSLAGGEPFDIEFRVPFPDGTVHWLQGKGRAFYDEGGQPTRMVGIGMDITERKRLERELQARAEQLALADRRKDEFLAMLAHELRNPLAAISNASYVLEQAGIDPPDAARLRTIIGRQAQHLSRLVDDLLDVSRITLGKVELRLEPADLREIADRAVEAIRPAILARRHDFVLELPSEPLPVKADQARLEQVIVNLLSNAVKYTEPEGRISLSLEREAGGGGRSTAAVRVRDTGMGITPELLPRIFDPFVQADRTLHRSQGGMGIGLALVRNLVEMHGGSVGARSEGLGKGAEFTVRLPVHRPRRSRAAADRAADAAGTVPQTRRVLIVEDNADAAETLAELVQLWGHEVQVARNAAGALQLVEDYPADVVLLDIGLPDLDGYELARRLREKAALRETLFVAMTGYAQYRDRRLSRGAGIRRHLVKPVDPEELRLLLEQ